MKTLEYFSIVGLIQAAILGNFLFVGFNEGYC